jgi:PAS domain S-box-containing protein
MTLRNIRNFLFGTLRGRLILSVAAVHALMMTLFIIDLTVRQRSMLLDNQAMQAVAMSQSLAISAAGWIAADDISGLQELVETERRYPEMLFAILTDENGQVLAHSDKSKCGLFLRDLPRVPQLSVLSKTTDLVDVAVPAMLGDHFVGWARIGIGQKVASEKLSQITTLGVMYALIAIVIGSLLAWYMGLLITRRLYTVQETINRVRGGNRQARSALTGGDEAAMMAKEFNSMLDAVAMRDAELQVSEEKYRNLIEKIQAAVVVHGADTGILMSNHLAQELLGLSEAQMTGKSAIDPDWHFYREDGSVMPVEEYPVNRVLATRDRLRNYVIGRRISGQNEIGWVLVGADPVFNEQNEITQVVVTFVDVTGRKKTEESLQEKMRHSQSLLRLSRRLESAQTSTEALNAAFIEVRDLLGYQSLWVYLLSEDHQTFRALTASGTVAESVMSESVAATLTIQGDQMLEEIASSEQIVVVEDARTDERTNKHIVNILGNRTIINVPIMLHDRHLGSVGTGTFGDQGVRVPSPSEQEYLMALSSHMAVALDRIHLLSEREQAEQSVRLQKAMLEGVVNSTSSAVFSIDRDYRYTAFNHAHAGIMQTIYGVTIEIGASLLDCMSNAEDRALAKANLDRSLQGEQFMSTAESGEEQFNRRYFEVTHNPVFDNDGFCTGVAVFAVDVTERKRTEAQIQHLASFPQLNPIGVIEFNPSKDVLFANASVQRLMDELGVSEPSELIPEAWSTRLLEAAWDSQEVGVEELTRGGRTIEETIFLVPQSRSLRIYVSDITVRKRSEEEIARMNRVLQMLSDSNQALIRATDEASLLNEICRIAVEIGNYRMLWIGFAEDDEYKSVRPVASAGFDAGYLESANITWADAERGRGPTGLSIRSGKMCLARNIPEDPAYVPWKEAAIKRGYQSSIALPLISDGKTFGTLSIYSDKVDAFDPKEIEILQELTSDLSFGISMLRVRANRDAAECALRKSEEKYRTLFEESLDGLFITSPAGRILDMNRKGVTMFGYDSKVEICALDLERDVYAYPPDRARVLEMVETLGSAEYDIVVKKRNGEHMMAHCALTPQKAADGTTQSYRGIIRDITEKKRAEERALKDTQRSKLLLELYTEARHLTDMELYNYALEKVVQLTDSTIGFFHFVSDDQKDVILTTWNREALKTCTAVYDTHYPLEQAGNWVDCVRFMQPVIYNDFPSSPGQKGLPEGHTPVRRFMSIPVSEDNKVRIIFGVGNKDSEYDEHDVTHIQLVANELHKIIVQRWAETALRESQRKLSLHLEQTLYGVIEWDADFKVRSWNAAAERIFGYTRDEAFGRTAPELIVPQTSHPEIETVWHHLLQQSGGTYYINDNLTKDGKTIVCEWINTPLTDETGHVTGVMSFANDITDRRRAENALLESEQKYKQIFENVLDGLYLLEVTDDGRFRTIDVNPMLEQITGVPRSISVGKTQEEIVPEESARIVNEKYRRCVAAGQVVEEEAELDLPSGQRIFHSTLVPTRDASGRIYRIIGISRDITESKKAERTILALNEQLEQRVRDRTADLQIANKELESFAYSVSHDLRAPLRHIDGFLELLQKQAGETLDPQSTHYMTTISRAAKRMGVLIDDLLSFSRMGRHELAKSRVDLRTLVKDVLHEFEPDLTERTVHWKISDSLPVVTGDQAMLRMVFVNLLANALKFTRTRHDATIEIGIVPDRLPETVVYVRDNGVGFDMHYSQKLFGVFQRLHREDEFEGTGIGLANVQRIIHRHGGDTWAEGQVDHGATFYFSLPNAG